MNTKYFKVSTLYPNIMVLKAGAEAIKAGKTVGFPTETVYGLGANGFDVRALTKVFRIKGRPFDNPLILHLASAKELINVASYIPSAASKAIRAFWPGPFTAILPKLITVPDEVTAGLPTVAVRIPSHPVAIRLIRLAGVPIAAPSANLSGRPSPTTGLHVLRDLKGKVDMIIDGGKCFWGIESTVVDFTTEQPTILRPGAVTREMLEEVVGQVNYDPALNNQDLVPRAPGVKYTHYAPRGKMFLVRGDTPQTTAKKLAEMVRFYKLQKCKTAVLATDETARLLGKTRADFVGKMGSSREPELIAARIYPLLHRCDRLKMEIIITEAIKEEGLGVAVMNRLLKASGHRVHQA